MRNTLRHKEETIPLVSRNLFQNGEFDLIATHLQNINNHCGRLEKKNLTVILEMHQQLVNDSTELLN